MDLSASRRLVAIGLVPLAAFVFAGCGDDKKDSASDSKDKETTQTSSADDGGDSGSDNGGDSGGGSVGGGAVSNEEYVRSLCVNFGGLITALSDVGSDVSAAMTDPETAGTAVAGVYRNIADQAREAASAMADAGYPEIDNGEEAAATMVDVMGVLADSLDQLADEVDGKSASELATTMASAGSELEQTMTEAGSRLDALGNDAELKQIAENTPECAALNAASNG